MEKLASSLNARSSQYPDVAYYLHGNCYLNVSNRCTLRCRFCPKFNHTWEVQGYNLRLTQEPSVAAMLLAVGDPSNYKEIVFCGLGEPTLRLYDVLKVARAIRARGVRRVRLNTDGLANLVHGKDVTPDLEDHIDALSVSLNAHDSSLYDYHCRPSHEKSYQAVIDFVLRAKAFVPDITVTAINGLEGVDIAACKKIADDLGVKFRERFLGQVG
ncbi:MAG: TatD family nuclease-associated radical SAM protein [Gammaproteobacteria bacterium]|nr:TatD family nuclease-associated radical SAM protein [Gammaproteobacteria bacterium]